MIKTKDAKQANLRCAWHGNFPGNFLAFLYFDN